jgi:hypothetical protein
VEYLIDQLWSELEYVPDDLTSVFPRRFPSEPISRYALKVRHNQINLSQINHFYF